MEPFDCIIIGAGDMPDTAAIAPLLAPEALVICADGGLRHCGKLGLAPDLLVGDLDSLDAPPPAGLGIVRLSRDKDYTDSRYAVDEALARGAKRLLLTGMTGGRLDHTLANLQLLASCAARGIPAMLTDGVTRALAQAGPGVLRLPCLPGHIFSLFAWTPCTGVTIRGAKYPLDDYPLSPTDPRAISNEFLNGDVAIDVATGILVAVMLPIKA